MLAAKEKKKEDKIKELQEKIRKEENIKSLQEKLKKKHEMFKKKT